MSIQITFTGNLVQDPELRFTPSGKAVAQVRIAHTPRVRQGEQWVDGETTWITGDVWGTLGENVAESLSRGDRVFITGTLRTESYESRDGETRTVNRVTVDEIGPSLRFATARPQRARRDAAPAADADAYHAAVQAAREQLGAAEVEPAL